MQWVPASALTPQDFEQLVKGAEPGGWEEVDVAEHLLSGRWTAFRWGKGCFAVEQHGDKLYVRSLAITGFGTSAESFRQMMYRLVSDLGCNTVETTCFDERMARLMVRIAAKPVQWVFQWQRSEQKEAQNGQH